MNLQAELPHLNAEEQRVLGALIEKSKTTPDYYPLTLNALTAACNQKSSRRPVVNYDEETVISALNSLKAQSLVAMAVGSSSRTHKYKHNFVTVHPIAHADLAILCLLLLRGPLTPGEINSNSARLHEFASLDSVNETLQRMANATPPMVKELMRRSGQKETRFVHLLGPVDEESNDEPNVEPARKSVNELEARVSALEQELETVKQNLGRLMKDLLGE